MPERSVCGGMRPLPALLVSRVGMLRRLSGRSRMRPVFNTGDLTLCAWPAKPPSAAPSRLTVQSSAPRSQDRKPCDFQPRRIPPRSASCQRFRDHASAAKSRDRNTKSRDRTTKREPARRMTPFFLIAGLGDTTRSKAYRRRRPTQYAIGP